MTPFLQQIAEAYIGQRRNTLVDHTFVFHNKRAATFFNNHLLRHSGGNLILPRTIDIDSLVLELTKSIVPSHIEQILILFNCYRRLISESGGDDWAFSLETFIPWGEMVLNDFNDTDLYMADPEELFRNLKHFKEISANFLTEEQVAIIEKYWGGDASCLCSDSHLWAHIDYDDGNKDTVRNFYRLWMLMYPLYTSFNKALSDNNRVYSGRAYRNLAEQLESGNDPFEKFPYTGTTFVFIGFNQLTPAVERVFSHLHKNGKAAFWWDDASAAFKNSINPGVRMIDQYKRKYPSDPEITYDFEAHIPDNLPEIEIIGVPSHYAEVKKGADILRNLLEKYPEDFSGKNMSNTAFVLPEEILVLPLLDSLPKYKNPLLPPDRIDSDENQLKVNLTMAYPQRNSPFSSLYKLLLQVYEHSRLSKGELCFYFKDIIALFSHPILRTGIPDICLGIVNAINKEHIFEVSRRRLISYDEELSALFPPAETDPGEDRFDTIRAQLIYLKKLTPENSIESAFASSYLKALDTLQKHCERFEVPIDRQTVTRYLSRIASSDAVHFAGEPLEGVQVMGMLETRALDFENIIILGANERVLPRKQLMKTFIPMSMRREYGLPAADSAEDLHAYYFYRLIGRAKRVFLVYDARTSNGGEMSRYLYQLIYIYGRSKDMRLRHHTDYYPLTSISDTNLSIDKNIPWISRTLQEFQTEGSGRYLSASAIKDYMECPLKFFLTKVAGYSIKDELKDYIEESGYGTIVHSVLENIYRTETASGKSDFFPEDLNIIRGTKKNLITRETVRAIKEKLYGLPRSEAAALDGEQLSISSLSGENALLATVIIEVVDNVLAAETKFRRIEYFRYYKGEAKIEDNIELEPGLNINVIGFIDRIDYVRLPEKNDLVLRFIDYKTGNEESKITNAGSLFDATSDNWRKGVFQLLFYCHAYSIKYKTDEPIIPQIYNIRKIKTNNLSFVSYKKDDGKNYNEMTDYHQLDYFRDRLTELLKELFDLSRPFVNRPSKSACKYCNFKSICNV